ncbi:unnamed protein product [Pleuronectes platessa]|uniref:Uncharacterized protein n=1 Tax=Pleuronectes platessa TaxID=8262 RepID=A0A9N7YBH5_PLEPL|nr:unnamed protein product [Pleuronectes platessa]
MGTGSGGAAGAGSFVAVRGHSSVRSSCSGSLLKFQRQDPALLANKGRLCARGQGHRQASEPLSSPHLAICEHVSFAGIAANWKRLSSNTIKPCTPRGPKRILKRDAPLCRGRWPWRRFTVRSPNGKVCLGPGPHAALTPGQAPELKETNTKQGLIEERTTPPLLITLEINPLAETRGIDDGV